jgi:hypothetical protein
MSAKGLVSLATLLAVSLTAIGTVYAVEWTITLQVPFSVQDLALTVATVDIGCNVLDPGGKLIGTNSTSVPISGGKYTGPAVAVPVTAKGPTYPSSWNCGIWQITDLNGVKCWTHSGPPDDFCKMKGVPDTVTQVKGQF